MAQQTEQTYTVEYLPLYEGANEVPDRVTNFPAMTLYGTTPSDAVLTVWPIVRARMVTLGLDPDELDNGHWYVKIDGTLHVAYPSLGQVFTSAYWESDLRYIGVKGNDR